MSPSSVSASAKYRRASFSARVSSSVLSIMPLFLMASADPDRDSASSRSGGREARCAGDGRSRSRVPPGRTARRVSVEQEPGQGLVARAIPDPCDASTMKREMALSAIASRSRGERSDGATSLPLAPSHSPIAFAASRLTCDCHSSSVTDGPLTRCYPFRAGPAVWAGAAAGPAAAQGTVCWGEGAGAAPGRLL